MEQVRVLSVGGPYLKKKKSKNFFFYCLSHLLVLGSIWKTWALQVNIGCSPIVSAWIVIWDHLSLHKIILLNLALKKYCFSYTSVSDPDPIRIKGFDDQKLTNNVQLEKKLYFLIKKKLQFIYP